jgi:hypothetical protein
MFGMCWDLGLVPANVGGSKLAYEIALKSFFSFMDDVKGKEESVRFVLQEGSGLHVAATSHPEIVEQHSMIEVVSVDGQDDGMGSKRVYVDVDGVTKAGLEALVAWLYLHTIRRTGERKQTRKLAV